MTTELAVPTMSVDAARRITERIRITAHTARESIEKLYALVDEAKNGNAHLALDYPSWTAYLRDVFGEEPLRLARDQRKELVSYLSGEGMSTRAIAPIVGVDDSTVARDIQSGGGAANAAPEPETARTEAAAESAPPAEDPVPVETPKVTGLDGKTYRKPAPKPRAETELPPPPKVNSSHVSRKDKAEQISALAEQGYSSYQMEPLLGTRAKTIRDIGRTFGIEIPADKVPKRPSERTAERIAELAGQGYTSRQIATSLGMGETYIKKTASRFEVEIPADKTLGKTRRLDSNRIAEETVNALTGLAIGVDLINYTDLDTGQAAHWVTSLDESLPVLNQFRKNVRKVTQ